MVTDRYRYRPNDDEACVAAAVAKRRNSLNGGGSNIPGGETATHEERFLQHYRAALAEIAVSRMTNLCWTGCGKGAEGLRDVGDALEVRSVASAGRGLLVRPPKNGDPEDTLAPHVLVLVTEDRWCVPLGWETYGGVKAKGRSLGADSDRPCWILEAGSLRPFAALVSIVSPRGGHA